MKNPEVVSAQHGPLRILCLVAGTLHVEGAEAMEEGLEGFGTCETVLGHLSSGRLLETRSGRGFPKPKAIRDSSGFDPLTPHETMPGPSGGVPWVGETDPLRLMAADTVPRYEAMTSGSLRTELGRPDAMIFPISMQ